MVRFKIRPPSTILRYGAVATVVWTLLVVASALWNVNNLADQTVVLATAEARSNWNKDQAFRRWATQRGGLYVVPDERTPPNPYLAHLPNRDVETTDGMKLTLMNPAYMMRQITEQFEDMYGTKGKITARVLLNPINKADPWELMVLNKFEGGAKEVIEKKEMGGQPYIRLMRPMVMEKGCLKCHGALGFKEGDIRGGVSVSVPLSKYMMAEQNSKDALILTHGGVWIMGMAVIGFVSWRGKQLQSERTKSREALRKSEKRFRIFAETSAEWFWEMDENLRFSYFSERFSEISGIAEEDLIGKTRQQSGLDMQNKEILENIADLEAHRPFKDFEHSRTRGDGSVVHMSTAGTPIFDENGTFAGYQGTGTNITKRKRAEENLLRSEERFHGLAELIPLSIQELDIEGRLLYCNRAHSKITGYSQEESIGKGVWQFLAPQKREELRKYIAYIAQNQPTPEPYFTKNQRKDGSVFDAQSYWTYKRDAAGQLIGFISLTADITERVKAENELTIAKEEAERANTAKSEFLASMSHELRTPLNAILGFAQMLQFDPQNPLSAAQKDHTDSILEGGHHLLELVNEVLDLARVEADQFDLSVDKVNANEIIVDCVNLIAPLGVSRDIKIINQAHSAVPEFLWTDQTRLKQILINLLSNAVKFNKDGGTVTIEGHVTDYGFLRISVTDTGIGIAKQDYGCVFQLFHRLDADPMVAREGTGIGLTVCKLLVERMAGRIGFESEKGRGSTFWIDLPLASNEDVLIWTEDLQVGVDTLDKDHQVLISFLNRLARRSADDEDVDEIINELVDYAGDHFKREEAILEVSGHPQLAKRRALHQKQMAQVRRRVAAWHRERNPKSLRQLRTFLKDCLFDTIVKKDTKIAAYTKGKGREIRTALERLRTSNEAL